MQHIGLKGHTGELSMNYSLFSRPILRRRHHIQFMPALLAAVLTLVVSGVLIAPLRAEAAHAHSSTQVTTFAVGVGVELCTFVDHTRSVTNYSKLPFVTLSASRTLATEIRYPTQVAAGSQRELTGANPVAHVGGYPTIVFAHGYDVTPDKYKTLLDSWVRAGFVVVAPIFPEESPSAVRARHGANTEWDLVNEPGDLAFVTKAVLQASTKESASCPIA